MEALVLTYEGETAPPVMRGLAEEFVEDPHCRLVLLGADSEGALLVTIWESDMVAEVEDGLADQAVDGVQLRRMKMIDPRNPTRLL